MCIKSLFSRTRSDERDPSGLSPNQPGAKLDAGKNRVWLMLEGFAPALTAVMGRVPSQELGRVEMLLYANEALTRWPRALEAVAEVTTAGAAKYTPGGWKDVENGAERYLDAYGRHAIALAKGEEYDDAEGGTGCLHAAQLVWNLLAALSLLITSEDKFQSSEVVRLGSLGALARDFLNELEADLSAEEMYDLDDCEEIEVSPFDHDFRSYMQEVTIPLSALFDDEQDEDFEDGCTICGRVSVDVRELYDAAQQDEDEGTTVPLILVLDTRA